MSNKSLHKDIENLAVLLGGGVSLLVICNVVLLVVVCLLISGCGTSRKVERMQERQMRAEIGMVEEMPDRGGHDVERWPVGSCSICRNDADSGVVPAFCCIFV